MALLEVADLVARYGRITALRDVSLTVDEGEIVSLLGRNGVGRSTTCKAIIGLVPPQGEIRYRLVPIDGSAATRVELSIGYTLTGLLAQVGRPGLVRDLAARLIAEFAVNLDRRMSDRSIGDVVGG